MVNQTRNRWLLILLPVSAILVQACSSIVPPIAPALTATKESVNTSAVDESPSAQTPVSEATLQPPLTGVEFPSDPIPYPQDWPEELQYPDEFKPVEVTSGSTDGTSTGWAAKLQYSGDPKSAANRLSSFFTENGWQIVEQTDLDSGGVFLLIEKNNESSGIVVFDTNPNDPASTNIVATVFL